MNAVEPITVETFVRRLLATEDASARRAMIEAEQLPAGVAHAVGLRLAEEATRLVGVHPIRMEQICLDAIALGERAGDDYIRALGNAKLGDALRAQGRNAEALLRLDEAAAVFNRLGHPVEAARTRADWLICKGALGFVDEALAAVRMARRMLKAHGDTLHLAILELNTGVMLVAQGRYGEAQRRFTAALKLSTSLGTADRIGIYRARGNRGLVYTRTGRHRQALVELEFARAGYLELHETAGYQRVIHRIGENLMALGRYREALQAFHSSWETLRQLGSASDAVTVAHVIADCQIQLNRPLDALAILDEAERDLAGVDTATDALGLAVRRVTAYLALGQQDQALAVQEEAERRYPTGADQHRAWLAAQRAEILARNGTPEQALAAAARAEQLARARGMRRLVCSALLSQGFAQLGLGDLAAASRANARARRLAIAEDVAPLLARVQELQGRIGEAHGDAVRATRAYAAAIAQVEREQQGVIFEYRESFARDRGGAYERLASLQLAAGNSLDALRTVERAKSRALVDAIAGRIVLRPRGASGRVPLVHELGQAREQYAEAAAQRPPEPATAFALRGAAAPDLAPLEARIAGLIEKIQLAAEATPSAQRAGGTVAVTLPRLPVETGLVEFYFSGEDVLRFQLDAAGVRGRRLSGAVPELTRLLRAFRLNLDATAGAEPSRRAPLADQMRRLLHRLYERLFADAGDLGRYRSLVVVPHGLLHYLPFHALFDGERYLIERAAVCYAPSATLYGVCQARARQRRRAGTPLVIGHSAGGRLPYALAEAEAVGN
ncbi:MAG TPA: CHAT domain-containing protein, partial [Dehalococcoidia bacterium]|nr:CHAT domain-containing protein [Dehalococcoidia bacterium]